MSKKGYLKHREHAESSNPLTEAEIEMQKIRMNESAASAAAPARSHINGVSLPFSGSLDAALGEYASKSINMLAIVIKDETFDVYSTKTGGKQDLDELIPKNTPGFVLCDLGAKMNCESSVPSNLVDICLVFSYVCPPAVSIKQKMIYSSSKTHFVSLLEEKAIKFDHKFEVDSVEELKAEINAVESKNDTSAPSTVKFSKPVRPGRK